MNQQRQVVYDLRKQALNDNDITDAIDDMVDDYVDDELTRMEDTSPQNWDWDNLGQNLSSHMLVDASLDKVQLSLIHI